MLQIRFSNFFSSGPNSDQLGFVVLSVEDSRLKVRRDYDDFCDSTTIGYLLASTYYFVHYFSVRIRREDSGVIRPGLELLGNKLFKSSAIVHACWSPHLPEESLMLLECLGQRNGGKDFVARRLPVKTLMERDDGDGGGFKVREGGGKRRRACSKEVDVTVVDKT
ncbi:hypothetical protein L6452_35707 [Arctium lappa]|uniref:Uncharacterized protein n=1 Tax=Arctium lappa TaxID=4217 RepID=A0ACB8Y776_ARCLA|nr:hypothetical protein L6452_35707 [Arctium lappa]